MSVFSVADFEDHEQVSFIHDKPSGLRAILAIHDTALGPALGGCRMFPYESEEDALRDVLRLSRGMSYKAAIAGVSLGGGKSVIIGDPGLFKSEAVLRAMGRAVDSLGGRYIVGEDIGTNPSDMRVIRTETRFVSCLEQEDGGYGDPAPLTALGVLQAIRAGLEFSRGTQDLNGLTIAVQGAGNVGYHLCKLLADAGAKLLVCDSRSDNSRRAEGLGATIVSPTSIYAAEADIFVPCAIGGILNDSTIPQINADIIAGAANNQLEDSRHAQMLLQRGIVHLPDYVANGGGLISCAAEWYRTDPSAVRSNVLQIYETCMNILRHADASKVTPQAAADEIARRKLTKSAERLRPNAF